MLKDKLKSEVILLPCCFFPTRVAIVSEAQGLNDQLTSELSAEFLAFNQSTEAFEFLKSYRPQIIENRWLERGVEDPKNLSYKNYLNSYNPMTQFNIDTNNIKEVSRNPLSTQDISVFVVDYNMPSLNGLELLTKLSDKPFKTILLVDNNSADLALAQDVMNKKLINGFLNKNEENVSRKLNSLIQQLQKVYFKDLSKETSEILTLDNPFFSDKEMIDYFYDVLTQNQSQEFYLINLQGNFLFINQDNQKKYFCAYTGDQLSLFADYVNADGKSSETSLMLKQGKQVPFFGEGKSTQDLLASEWQQCLYSTQAEVQTSRHKFYTAIVES
jgi:CheY-like chemotaxis protein